MPGKRAAEDTGASVRDFRRRTSGRLMDLMTTDEYAPYRGAILEACGETVTPARTGKRGRPRRPYKVPPAGLAYATVHKTRSKKLSENRCNAHVEFWVASHRPMLWRRRNQSSPQASWTRPR